MTATTVQVPVRLDFDAHAPVFAKALAHLDNAATKQLDQVDFDHRLRELVRDPGLAAQRMRVLHRHAHQGRPRRRRDRAADLRAARLAGDAVLHRQGACRARLHRVGDPAGPDHVPAGAYAAVAAEYSPDEIAALVSLLVAINAWNTVGVSTRTWVPGTYEL